MFYAEFGNSDERHPPNIARMPMDGWHGAVLGGVPHVMTQGIQAPVGLALDYVNNKLYWSDAHLDHVQAVDYTLQNRFVLICRIR